MVTIKDIGYDETIRLMVRRWGMNEAQAANIATFYGGGDIVDPNDPDPELPELPDDLFEDEAE